MTEIGEPGYWAFISYSWSDRRFVSWLQRSLETAVLPKHANAARTRTIFVDHTEMAAGRDLDETLEGALKRSQALIVVLSEAAAASASVNLEIERFIEAFGPGRVVGILADGASNNLQACLPPAFARAMPGNPLLADARKRRDWGAARDQILAFLADVALDEVVQRRRRRQVRFAALAGAVSVVLLSLALFWLDAAADGRRADAYLRDAQSASGYERVRLLVAAFRAVDGPFRGGRGAVEAALKDPLVRLMLAAERADVTGQPIRMTRDYLARELGDVRSVLELTPMASSSGRVWYLLPRPWAEDLAAPETPLFRAYQAFDLGRLLVVDSSGTSAFNCDFTAFDVRTGEKASLPQLPVSAALRAADRRWREDLHLAIDAEGPERIACKSVRSDSGRLFVTLEHLPEGPAYGAGVESHYAWRPGEPGWQAVSEPPPEGEALESLFANEPDGWEVRLSPDGARLSGHDTATGRIRFSLVLSQVRTNPPGWRAGRVDVIDRAPPYLLLRVNYVEPVPDGYGAADTINVALVLRDGAARPVFEKREPGGFAGAVEGFWDDRSIVAYRDEDGDYGRRVRTIERIDFNNGKATTLMTTDIGLYSVGYLGRRRFAISSVREGADAYRVVATYPSDAATSAELVSRFCRFGWWGVQRRALDRYLAQPSHEPASQPCR